MASIPVGTIAWEAHGPYIETDSEGDSDDNTDQENRSSSQYSAREREYEYRQLKTDEIRLLILNPGLPDDPIECFLEHYSVNQAKPYLALSYVWGDAQDSSFIQVDGCPFKITGNLRSFLNSYRTNNTCPVLWIDAICINQKNISERNAQIRLMKRVYEGSDSVVIWLGPDVDGTKMAFQYMNTIYREYGQLDELDVDFGEDFGDLRTQEMHRTQRMQEIVDDSKYLDERVWSGIQDILERPWWSRVWIYQEATAPARSGSVMWCGPYKILLKNILVVNNIFKQLALGGFPGFRAQASLTGALIEEYSELRREYHQKGSSSFLKLADLLPTLREFAASNPRDKLYALIPTSLDGADMLDVDYGLSVVEVYTSAALSFIHKHRNLDILGHCTGLEQDSRLVLPSWVPDWTSNRAPVHLFKRGVVPQPTGEFVIEDLFIGKLYHASSDTVAMTRIDESSTKLFCQGFQYDFVDFVSLSTNNTFKAEKVASSWAQWLESLSCEFTEEDFSRTLAADCMRLGVDIGCRNCKVSLLPVSGASAPPNEVRELSTDGGAKVDRGIIGVHPSTFRRRLIVTKKRHIGLAAENVQRGDMIVILMGAQVPIILRKVEGHYVLIGEAYIHEIMDGEALSGGSSTFKGSSEEFEIW